ncbi:MAG TPA: hypothetical protein PLZ46_05520 [Bacteroidales bacterium]|nr:hypothetical protein [Bacteroidales bacterium]
MQFFKADCQETTDITKFGLYDAEDNTPVKIKLTDEELWNATVLNNSGKSVLYTAIDNCIDVFRPNGNMNNCCDCMLTYNNTLLLVELKNKRESWQSEGLAQIESIVKTIIEEIPDFSNEFKTRKAIVANRKHQFPVFHESNIEQRQTFRSKYRMRTIIERRNY